MEKRNLLLCIFILLISIPAFAQMGYQEGYIITNTGESINCYINADRIESYPFNLEYRLEEDSDVIYASASGVKEFGIPGHIKYIRSIISTEWLYERIDSVDFYKPAARDRNYIFLRTIVEGMASVFSFDYKNEETFFYRIGDGSPEELVTLTNSESVEEKNIKALYRDQLRFTMAAPGIEQRDIQYLKYDDGDMADLFTTYNLGINSKPVNYNNIVRNRLFKLRIKTELRYSLLDVTGGGLEIDTLEMGKKLNAAFGIETEMVLPFLNRRFSLLLEPSYHSYSNSTMSPIRFTLADSGEENKIEVRHNAVDISFGVKVKLVNNWNNNLAISGKAIASLPFNSKWYKEDEVLFVMPWADIFPAAALSWEHGRITVEAAYYFRTDLIHANPRWDSRFRSFSISLGYNILGSGK